MEMDFPTLHDKVLEVCALAEADNGYIRLNVTRGTGLGLDPRAVKTSANVMIMINTLALYTPDQYERGLDVVTTSYRVIPPDSLDPRLKCIGRYAGNIAAKAEANARGAGEGLMLNQQGYVAECTGDNLFVIKNGVLRTPHPASGILKGITRDTVIELAKKEGIPVVEDFMTSFDIISADEAFLTGTAAEVIPMRSLDDKLIGDGSMGPMTRKLIAMFRDETTRGTPFSAAAATS